MKKEQEASAILKELSDIKSSLAVNTSETKNIKETIGEIKTDVKEIKNDNVNRREFTEALTVIRDEMEEKVSPLRKFIYGIIGIVGAAIIGGIMTILMKHGN